MTVVAYCFNHLLYLADIVRIIAKNDVKQILRFKITTCPIADGVAKAYSVTVFAQFVPEKQRKLHYYRLNILTF